MYAIRSYYGKYGKEKMIKLLHASIRSEPFKSAFSTIYTIQFEDYLSGFHKPPAQRAVYAAVNASYFHVITSYSIHYTKLYDPLNFWYGGIDSEEKIDEILDALENEEAVEAYLISD